MNLLILQQPIKMVVDFHCFEDVVVAAVVVQVVDADLLNLANVERGYVSDLDNYGTYAQTFYVWS